MKSTFWQSFLEATTSIWFICGFSLQMYVCLEPMKDIVQEFDISRFVVLIFTVVYWVVLHQILSKTPPFRDFNLNTSNTIPTILFLTLGIFTYAAFVGLPITLISATF